MKQKSQNEEEQRERYVCIGSVRGWCGHRHKSIATAIKCIERDMSGCKSQGGYSDRNVYRLSDVRDKGNNVYIPQGGPHVEPVDTFGVE